MDKQVNRGAYRFFSHSSAHFDGLDGKSVAQLASLGADISLLIGRDGGILDVAFRDSELESYGLSNWIGKAWRDTVTVESTPKIDELVADENAPVSRPRQVNHAAKGLTDLPVSYTLIRPAGIDARIAIGEDLRKTAAVQQKLMQAQSELEREYRKLRESEVRYRAIFHKAIDAVVVVDGSDLRIVDVNNRAANMLSATASQLAGTVFPNSFAKTQRATVAETLKSAQMTGRLVSCTAGGDKSGEEIRISADPYREEGRVNLIVTMQHTRAQDTDRGEAPYPNRMLFDALPEAYVVLGADGTVDSANEQFLDMIHALNDSSVIGRNIDSWIGGSPVDMTVLKSRLREDGLVRKFSTVLRDELGSSSPVTVSASTFPGTGNAQRIVLLVTEQPANEERFEVRPGGDISSRSDFSELVGRVPLKDLIREASDVIEKLCIEAALRQTGNNRASAAEMLGLSRQSLYIKLRRHGLEDFDGKV